MLVMCYHLVVQVWLYTQSNEPTATVKCLILFCLYESKIMHDYVVKMWICFLYLILCVSQNSFHRSLSSSLDNLLDVVILGLKMGH